MKSKAGKAKSKSAGRSKVAARVAKARSAAPARVKPKNPLLARWGAAFGLPPFKKIEPQHFKAAFAAALKENKAEIAAIAGETAKPTFNNTIVALEKSARLIEKVASVFYNLAGAHTNEALQAIEREMAPKLAAHETAVMLNARIFKRVEDLYERRADLDLTDEQRRVLELRYKWLVRAGAKLGAKQKARVAEINQRLATLATQFSQNVLKDEQVLAAGAGGTRPRRPAGSAARSRCARRRRPGACRQVRHHAVALVDRAVPAVLRPPRSARGGVQRLDPARRDGQGDRQPRHHRRDHRAARRVRGAARLQDLRRVQPRRDHGQVARQRARAALRGVGAGRRSAPPASATRCSCGPARKAATSPSRRGTGATSPRRSARRASTSTRRRRVRTWCSTTSSPPPSTRRRACSD